MKKHIYIITALLLTLLSNFAIYGQEVEYHDFIIPGDRVIFGKQDGDIDTITDFSNVDFDGNRDVRSGITGITGNYGGTTIQEWLDRVFFISAPTITLLLNSSTANIVIEVGTTITVAISGQTSNPSSLTLATGYVTGMISPIEVTGTTPYGGSILFEPDDDGLVGYVGYSYSFTTTQDYSGVISGTASSSTRTLTAVFPYLSGISSTNYVAGTPTQIYNAFSANKSVVVEATTKAVSYTGTGYVYFLYPSAYGHLTQILNPSLLDEFDNFTEYTVTVTSTGLVHNYEDVSYYMYKTDFELVDLVSYTYTFKQ